jgi:hypothetical protein
MITSLAFGAHAIWRGTDFGRRGSGTLRERVEGLMMFVRDLIFPLIRSVVIVVSLIALDNPVVAQSISKKTLHNFGDWRIDRIESNRSFVLVGVGNVKGDTRNFIGFRYFEIQCFEESDAISIQIPYDKKREHQRQSKSLMVSIWSDRNPPNDLVFYLINEFLLVAMTGSNNKVSDDSTRSFISILEKAEQRFSFNIEEKSVHFDMTDFRAAWAKFRQLCARQ